MNPSQFNDPVAATTLWTPVAPGGISFTTHTLQQGDFDCLEFKASGTLSFAAWFALILGICLIVSFPLFRKTCGGNYFGLGYITPILVGILFLFIGVYLFKLSKKKIVIDKRNSIFWKGNSAPNETIQPKDESVSIKFSDIHALQIIPEYCEDKIGPKKDTLPSFYSYELNLVLTNCKRINVIDHGNYKQLLEDANKVADYLEKPLWDASI